MGKSKARILRKGINDIFPTMSRDDAIQKTAQALENGDTINAKRYIEIFGLYADEILEQGASYESVMTIKNVFKNE